MGTVNTFLDSISAVSPPRWSDGEDYVPPRNQQSSDTGANDGNYTQLHSLVSLLDNYIQNDSLNVFYGDKNIISRGVNKIYSIKRYYYFFF